MTLYPKKTTKTVEVGPFRLNLVRMARYESYEVPTRDPNEGDDDPLEGWQVDLWHNWNLVQSTKFPDEDLAMAVFNHLADGLPVRVARIAHGLDR